MPEEPQQAFSDPPYLENLSSDQACKDLLNALLIDPLCIDQAYVEPEEFENHRYREVYRAMKELGAEGKRIDISVLLLRLQDNPLPDVNWLATLTELEAELGHSWSMDTYQEVIRDRSNRRKELIRLNQEVTRLFDPRLSFADVGRGRNPRFQLQSAAKALEPQPPTEWVVKGLLPRGSVGVIYGEPGSKKTYSTLSLETCVAAGKPWCGYETVQGPVLFIDEESGEARLLKRLGMTLRASLADESLPMQYTSLAGFHLDDPRDVAWLKEIIKREEIVLVVIDSFSAIVSGDENSKKDMQPVMTALRQIAEETGAAMVVIHHPNKAQEKYRGSSVIKAAADLFIHMRSENGSDYVSFTTEKNRDGAARSWAARAVWVGDKQFYLEECAPKKEEAGSGSRGYVLHYLEENGASPMQDILENAEGCTSKAALVALYKLRDEGLVKRTSTGTPPNDRRAWYILNDREESKD